METPSTSRTPSFEDIAVANRKRLEQMGVVPNNKAVVQSLMQMISCMGELSNLAYHTEATLSPFEHDEVRSVIGRMAVCLATIGETFDINVGQAAMDAIVEQQQKVNDARATRSKGEPNKSLPMRVSCDRAADTDGRPNCKQPDVLLSPTSNRDFFGYLDELVTYSPDEFEKADLKWVAPLPDGTIQELIENGSTINVRYEDLSKYLDCVKLYRNARANENQTNKRRFEVSGAASAQQATSATMSIDTGNTLPDKNELLFSMGTLDSGLKSPVNSVPSALAPQVSISKATAAEAPSGEISCMSETDFYATVDALKRGHVTGARIALLNLTFSVPRNGKLVELIPNGIHVRVTAANVTEFLRLVEDKSAILNGRVRRLESIKRLEVAVAASQDLSQEKDKFSPTHFSKDIFAPYDERTSFLVDCDASDEILPAFIKEREQQRKAESTYVRVVRQGDVKKWRSIIDEVTNDPSALHKYGVTFCIPSTVALNTTEEEQGAKIYELMKRGTTTPVEKSQLWLFSRMIEQSCHPCV